MVPPTRMELCHGRDRAGRELPGWLDIRSMCIGQVFQQEMIFSILFEIRSMKTAWNGRIADLCGYDRVINNFRISKGARTGVAQLEKEFCGLLAQRVRRVA